MKLKRIFLFLFCAALLFAALSLSPAAEQKYVFVSDSGDPKNSGLSDAEPVKTLAQAFQKLGADGGTVVVCGATTLNSAALATFPKRDSLITFTSVWDGVDYGAKGARLSLQTSVFLGGPTQFENIKLTSGNGVNIFCCGNDLTMGGGVTCQYAQNPMAIWGGTDCAKLTVAHMADFYDYTIQIDSGTFWYVRGGSLRTDETQPVGTIGDVTILINGGTFTSTSTAPDKNGIIAVSGFDALYGDAHIIINGGTINCSVMGVGRPGYNSTVSNNAYVKGDVHITVNGGNFRAGAKIGAVHDTVASYVGGDFYLTVSGGYFPASFGGFDAQCVRGTAFADIAPTISQPMTGFARTVFVSGSGNDAASGKTADMPKKTLSAAAAALYGEGGVIVVCGDTPVGGETLAAYSKTLRITSAWAGKDYRAEGAKLILDGTLTLGGETRLEGMTIAGNGGFNAAGHDLLAGQNLICTGAVSLDGGAGSGTHGVIVRSGSFSEIRGGGVTDSGASTFVLFEGGSVGTIYGGGAGTRGGCMASVRGGNVTNGVYAAEAGTPASGGVELLGGTVAGTVAPSKSGTVAKYSLQNRGASVTASITESGAQSLYENGAVVFVRDGGDGDGSSPLNAMGDVTEASAKLSGGGTIVVCGKVAPQNGKTLRYTGGKVTITSFYGGLDYAVLDDAQIELWKYLSLADETEIRDIRIVAAANDTYISAEGNRLTVGEGVRCEIFYDNRTEDYPDLVAGSAVNAPSLKKNPEILVCSGTWGSLCGGQFSTKPDASASRRLTGDITLTVRGGVFTDDCIVGGINNLTGNAVLNAEGGVFACSVFGMAGEALSYTGNITVNAAGSAFEGDIRAAQDKTPTFSGVYTLNIAGSDVSRASSILGTDGLAGGGSSAVHIAEGVDLTRALSGRIEYQNPIAGFADPSIVYADGWYYYTFAKDYKSKPAVWMAKAANLCDIGKVEPVLVWGQAESNDGQEITSVWAPQLYYLDGDWYVYTTCGVKEALGTSNYDVRIPQIWKAKTQDPIGGYTYMGTFRGLDTAVTSYLSPRLIEHGGKLYMVCSGCFRPEDMINQHLQRLFMCELSDPLTMATPMQVISDPIYDYEKNLMEGPFPFYGPDGTLYMIFAAGHTRTDEYCTGIIRFNGGEKDSLLKSSLWEKFSEPLQFTDYDNLVYSPGAMVVTRAPDGEYFGVYHAKEYHYSAFTMRRMHMQPITFDENGFPHIDDPQPVDTVHSVAMNPMPVSQRINGFDTTGKLPAVSPFKPVRTYENQFADVTADKWFYPYVTLAYEYALANGTSGTAFSPDSKFTVAQALTAAANIHTAYFGGSVPAAAAGEAWYAPYVSYCVEKGIITASQFADYNQNITRGEMAVVFAAILPEREYAAVRTGVCPDVGENTDCYAAVTKLYQAGIVGGDSGTGNYRPDDEIIRSEACVIFTRIAAADKRITK